MVRGDSLHVLYSRGVGSHLAGSILHYMRIFDWPKRQKSALPPGFRRSLPESKWEKNICPDSPWLQTHRSHTRHTHVWGPKLQKQSISSHAWSRWWRKVFLNTIPFTTPCWTAWRHSPKCPIFDATAGFPTPSEFTIAQDLAKTNMIICMPGPRQKNGKLFHITHKFHTAHHLIRNAQHLNFRMHHNFKTENFVGQVSVMVHSVSFGNAATRVCQKLKQIYLILLHLQLTRLGFGTLAGDDCDPWTHWQNGDPCTAFCEKGLWTDLDKRYI